LICALRLYMSHSTALRLCYAFGSNIDVARCGWEFRICEQWQIQCATKVAPPKILIVMLGEAKHLVAATQQKPSLSKHN
ncbi:MAG: hypothetical protein K2N20_06975, partial [Helicobacter sp.]|nr:hypothetical protein [Helicobacter sp.]